MQNETNEEISYKFTLTNNLVVGSNLIRLHSEKYILRKPNIFGLSPKWWIIILFFLIATHNIFIRWIYYHRFVFIAECYNKTVFGIFLTVFMHVSVHCSNQYVYRDINIYTEAFEWRRARKVLCLVIYATVNESNFEPLWEYYTRDFSSQNEKKKMKNKSKFLVAPTLILFRRQRTREWN